jgi:hypothetical protein
MCLKEQLLEVLGLGKIDENLLKYANEFRQDAPPELRTVDFNAKSARFRTLIGINTDGKLIEKSENVRVTNSGELIIFDEGFYVTDRSEFPPYK